MNNSIDYEISSEMIKRYNLSGPRYTSYPTVPVWNEGDFYDDYTNRLRREGESNNQITLYIHIPFCKQLCTYCGCNKYITNNHDLVEKYLSASFLLTSLTLPSILTCFPICGHQKTAATFLFFFNSLDFLLLRFV